MPQQPPQPRPGWPPLALSCAVDGWVGGWLASWLAGWLAGWSRVEGLGFWVKGVAFRVKDLGVRVLGQGLSKGIPSKALQDHRCTVYCEV